MGQAFTGRPTTSGADRGGQGLPLWWAFRRRSNSRVRASRTRPAVEADDHRICRQPTIVLRARPVIAQGNRAACG